MNLQIAIPPGPDYLSYEDFAKEYGVSLNTVKDMIRRGEILTVPRTSNTCPGRNNMIASSYQLPVCSVPVT